MKKLLALALAIILIFSLISCNTSVDLDEDEDTTVSSGKDKTTSQKTERVTEAETEEETGLPEEILRPATFTYKSLGDGTCLVSSVNRGNQTKITIPKKSPDGDTVIGIDKHVFFMQSEITEVILPDTIKTIGEGAFQKCTSLKSINFPDGIETIGDVAFAKCQNLQDVYLPASLTSVGNMAFVDCNSLKSFAVLTSSIEYIGSIYSSPSTLEYIVVPYKNAYQLSLPDSYCENLHDVFVFDVEYDDEYSFEDSQKLQEDLAEILQTSAKISFYSESSPTISGNFWRYVDEKPTIWE